MIVRPRPPLWKLFFILKGSIVTRILPQIFAVFVLSLVVVWAHRAFPGWVPAFNNGTAFALLGIALSIFLGFRNNACYDRWWEARKVWGKLVHVARSFARQTMVLDQLPGAQGARAKLLHYVIAFTQSMVPHLRPDDGQAKAHKWLNSDEQAAFTASRNGPDFVLRKIGEILAELRGAGRVDAIDFQTLDETVKNLAEVQAACERLRFTPVPFGYTLLLHRTAYLFCFFIPFGFADMLGWGTPFATTLVAYTFFGLDALGDELEEPFGTLPNDLPIGAIADTIEINLREALGETNLPDLPQPKDYLLM
ncbi:bestrophin family protein [Brucella pseudogrignonensis]|uniref:Bestrophin n=1 Tax=Brucella pseudogrignonensis TaxID=419475 RepID=A0A256G1G4_9HYPH|nr:bestrophin family protein [Brucella pseudogrignonensis]MCD4513494.1 bestrophin family protein [Brucella pseudogrignonensis]MCM0752177.1 bestrophin [Brucella pseudogrignonensis]NNV19883.1 bestrophin [Brucella pseudogrignonensis]OYR20945.1 bestrophin, RFP-TM, chloride channel family protein [Brucella pseudogrignonensis]